MTHIAILPDDPGAQPTRFRAIAGNVQSVGRTAGEALDALAAQLDEADRGTLVVVQHLRPDALFTAAQQQRLQELMAHWRAARDKGAALSREDQAELDTLVDTEVRAAGARRGGPGARAEAMNPRYPFVAERAGHRCEYCHAPEAVFNFPFEVEHVVPTTLQGPEDDTSLALSCRACNVHKADHLTGEEETTGNAVRLFLPRLDRWEEHFQADTATGVVHGLSPVGRATVARLRMNTPAQREARLQWIRLGLFP